MNGLVFPVCKLGMLNPPLPDAVGETGLQSPVGLSLGNVVGHVCKKGLHVYSCKRGKSCGGEMTCPRSLSRSVVKLGLVLGNTCFLIPPASRYALGREVRGQAGCAQAGAYGQAGVQALGRADQSPAPGLPDSVRCP